jgi:hypothetical protein
MVLGILFAALFVPQAAAQDQPRTVALIEASFGHCGPSWRCDGPRLVQYLSALAALGGDVLVPYGEPGYTAGDFAGLAEHVAAIKQAAGSESETLDAVIIGLTGSAIASAISGDDSVIPTLASVVEIVRPYAERVIAVQYPEDIGPYNDYAAAAGWAQVDVDDWQQWRADYRAAIEAAGVEVIDIHCGWTAFLPGWHIDTASSYRGALRLWDSVLTEAE